MCSFICGYWRLSETFRNQDGGLIFGVLVDFCPERNAVEFYACIVHLVCMHAQGVKYKRIYKLCKHLHATTVHFGA